MNRTIPILCVIFIAISLALSGCIAPDIPDINQSGSTPMGDDLAPTPTPFPPQSYLNVTAEAPVDQLPVDKSNWDVCDDRHNATWLYVHKCWGTGGSGGSNSGGNTGPGTPIPEIATIVGVFCGVLLLGYICQRK